MKVDAIVQRSPKSIIDFLNKLPEDEVLTTREVAEKCGVSYERVKYFRADPKLADYCFLANSGITLYWGKKKAIESLRKRLG